MRKIVRFLWIALACVVCLIPLLILMVEWGWIGYMPRLDELQSPIGRYASQVLTADGKVMGTWSLSENRVFVDYDSISPHVMNALVATEDVRFYEHSGIDIRAVGRAIVKRGLMRHKEAGGGSTITQQLAKQLYSKTAHSTMERLTQKPVEWLIAAELERCYTKEEILTLYLNYFDFLHNAVGIKTAANVYFSKHPRNLSLAEAATLVGMCKNPSYFNPVRFPERAQQRRNVVLAQMVKAGKIESAEADSIFEQPVKLKFHRVDHKEGIAAYMREYLRRIMMASKPKRENYASWQDQEFYSDSLQWEQNPLYGWCNKNVKRDGTPYNIYTDGLKIYTTIDSRMQRYAEEAVRRHVAGYLQPAFNKQRSSSSRFPFSSQLSKAQVNQILERSKRQSERYRQMKADGASDKDIEKAFHTKTPMTVFSYHGEVDTVMTPMDSILYYKTFLRSAMVAIEPQTGYVKAYVGGLEYEHFQYDMAMVGRRQVGSTVKPFVYSMAMEDGRTPCDVVINQQRTYHIGGTSWTPRNGSKARYGQEVTLKWGLSQSNNWVTAEVMSQVDPTGHRFVTLLREYGVANRNIFPTIAQCLGPAEITVAEMAGAYTTFVNKGIRTAPILVTHIEDDQGNVVAEFRPRVSEVISERSSYQMLDMLQAVVDHGTAGRLRYHYGLKGQIAGKTGTTNRNSDGWFVGLVPRLVAACWVGGEDRDIHFNSMAYGQGAAAALPIWAYFMKKVYADSGLGYKESEKFYYPSDFYLCGPPVPRGDGEEPDAAEETASETSNEVESLMN